MEEPFIKVEQVMQTTIHMISGLASVRDAVTEMKARNVSALIIERRQNAKLINDLQWNAQYLRSACPIGDILALDLLAQHGRDRCQGLIGLHQHKDLAPGGAGRDVRP